MKILQILATWPRPLLEKVCILGKWVKFSSCTVPRPLLGLSALRSEAMDASEQTSLSPQNGAKVSSRKEDRKTAASTPQRKNQAPGGDTASRGSLQPSEDRVGGRGGSETQALLGNAGLPGQAGGVVAWGKKWQDRDS